ncbi:uncharacterized protein LOC103509257 [Diaphorina citri]|uniref:Uncharacterized protein LOC103509257 n=1 Tax=Diaphorina citri TaxID=121845 RepID=A0A1S4EBU2_DIACI|nr:uncharacterized protein LOC103509257 [Diaphorina citri]
MYTFLLLIGMVTLTIYSNTDAVLNNGTYKRGCTEQYIKPFKNNTNMCGNGDRAACDAFNMTDVIDMCGSTLVSAARDGKEYNYTNIVNRTCLKNETCVVLVENSGPYYHTEIYCWNNKTLPYSQCLCCRFSNDENN